MKRLLFTTYPKVRGVLEAAGIDMAALEVSILRWLRPIARRLGYSIDTFILRHAHFNRSAIVLPPPYATVLLTNRCTNQCQFCTWHSLDAVDYASDIHNVPFHISLAQFQEEVRILRRVGVHHIHLCSTGDPFLHRDVIRMIDYVIESGASVSIMTNFNRHVARYLPELAQRKLSYIATNAHSGDRAQFESIQQGLKWDTFFGNLREFDRLTKASNNKSPLEIAYIVTKSNYTHVRALIDACRGLDCLSSILLIGLQPMNFNDFTSFKNQIKDEDTEIILALREAVAYGQGVGIRVVMPKIYHPVMDKINCRNPWAKVMVNLPNRNVPEDKHIGTVTFGGCLAVTQGRYYSLGNLLDAPWEEIWNGEKIRRVRQMILQAEFPDDRCKECATHYWTEEELQGL